MTTIQKHRALPKYQSGFTIFEMIIGVGIFVAVASLVLGVSGPIMTTIKSNRLLGELNTFQQKIHEVYNGQSAGYTGISAQELVTSKAYPTSLNATTDTLTSSDAGNITIENPTSASFSIEYASVPSGVCIATVNKLTSAGSWNEIDIGGTSIWSGTDVTPTKASIDTACNATSNVAMKFISN
jgi:type II secretory pathway pseudopilin PulG